MNRPRWTAIILAAGQGTRMRSRLPKVVHPVAGVPIVRHVISCAREAGAEECVVVVGSGDDAVAVRMAAGSGVSFAVQDEALGTGHAVSCAREAAAGDYVLIMNGDVPLVRPETLVRLMDAVADPAGGPGAPMAVLTARVPVEEYGVLVLDGERIVRINETKGAGEIDRSEQRYINSGQYAVQASWLWYHLERVTPAENGERYLTSLAAIAHDLGTPAVMVVAGEDEVRGINDRTQLAEAEATMRDRIRKRHMLAGVTIVDPASTFIDANVTIGEDTTLLPGTHLQGAAAIGAACEIGPQAIIRDSLLGARCRVRASTIEESTLEDDVDMGPYSHLRPGAYLCAGVHIGNYAEVKNSRLGPNTQMGHFSYIGDADVGADVNIGAGTITANYDGTGKHRTAIGDGAFIGSDTMLVAPVRVGARARTSAGSVVTRDVPDGAMAIGAPARIRSQSAAEEESSPGR